MKHPRLHKRIISAAILTVAILWGPAFSTYADEEKTSNPIEKIEAESGGMISISIPDNILNDIIHGGVIAKPTLKNKIVHPKGKMSGYRIQVFSDGRNQTTLEARARARGSAIVARFPKYRGQVYSFSKSPNWYTRIGNFATQAEATAALGELKRAFPGFATEMRMVKCEIIVK